MFNNFKFQFHVQHGLAEFGSHSEGEPSGKANSPPPHLKEAINKIFFLAHIIKSMIPSIGPHFSVDELFF